MAARIAAVIFVCIKLTDPFCNLLTSYFSTLFVLRKTVPFTFFLLQHLEKYLRSLEH